MTTAVTGAIAIAVIGLHDAPTQIGLTTSVVPLRAPRWNPPAMIRSSRVAAPPAKAIGIVMINTTTLVQIMTMTTMVIVTATA